jgi:hypothetical protein
MPDNDPCSICRQPAAMSCLRCGLPLCAGCSHTPKRRCYTCEKELSARMHSRSIVALEIAVLTPLLAMMTLLGYRLALALEQLPNGQKSSTFMLLLIVPLVGIPMLWVYLRTRVQRARFLRERGVDRQAT